MTVPGSLSRWVRELLSCRVQTERGDGPGAQVPVRQVSIEMELQRGYNYRGPPGVTRLPRLQKVCVRRYMARNIARESIGSVVDDLSITIRPAEPGLVKLLVPWPFVILDLRVKAGRAETGQTRRP